VSVNFAQNVTSDQLLVSQSMLAAAQSAQLKPGLSDAIKVLMGQGMGRAGSRLKYSLSQDGVH